jgi:hypothetical protein
MEFSITTKQSDVGWGNPKDAVRFRPAENVQQMFQYHSAQTGKKTWLQVTLSYGYDSHHPGQVRRVFGILILSAEISAYFLQKTGGIISITFVVWSYLFDLERMIKSLYSFYSSHKAVLAELIEEARTHYLQASVSRVILHMTDGVCFPHHHIQTLDAKLIL